MAVDTSEILFLWLWTHQKYFISGAPCFHFEKCFFGRRVAPPTSPQKVLKSDLFRVFLLKSVKGGGGVGYFRAVGGRSVGRSVERFPKRPFI